MRNDQAESAHAAPLFAVSMDGAGTHTASGQPPPDTIDQPAVAAGVDALCSCYPTAARLAGDDRFRAAAGAYVGASAGFAPAVLAAGDAFERFLAASSVAAAWPCLPGLARLDRFCAEARTARDEPPLDPRSLAALAAEDLMRITLRPHASARWCWFDAQPAFTLWRRIRATGAAGEMPGDGRGEGALVVRARGSVRWLPLDAAGHAFVLACARGGTLADAAAAALAADSGANGDTILPPLLDAGAFAAVPGGPATARP